MVKYVKACKKELKCVKSDKCESVQKRVKCAKRDRENKELIKVRQIRSILLCKREYYN